MEHAHGTMNNKLASEFGVHHFLWFAELLPTLTLW